MYICMQRRFQGRVVWGCVGHHRPILGGHLWRIKQDLHLQWVSPHTPSIPPGSHGIISILTTDQDHHYNLCLNHSDHRTFPSLLLWINCLKDNLRYDANNDEDDAHNASWTDDQWHDHHEWRGRSSKNRLTRWTAFFSKADTHKQAVILKENAVFGVDHVHWIDDLDNVTFQIFLDVKGKAFYWFPLFQKPEYTFGGDRRIEPPSLLLDPLIISQKGEGVHIWRGQIWCFEFFVFWVFF